jgi:hypothetical protein
MKRKPQPRLERVVSEEILEQAKRSITTDRLQKVVRCKVCDTDTPAESIDQLCWVCRRLKISAWREVENQMPAQD